ncbi:hypothetical protein A2I34_03360 [Salmonella enterica]|nr:hypothetical protein A2I34_03360 [Salmonella enterica]
MCGSQNGLLAQLHENTGIYCPVALRLPGLQNAPGRPDKAFTPLPGITHQKKRKGCARICVTRERKKVGGGAKPRQ